MKDVSQEERREEKTTFKVGWRQVSSSTTCFYCYMSKRNKDDHMMSIINLLNCWEEKSEKKNDSCGQLSKHGQHPGASTSWLDNSSSSSPDSWRSTRWEILDTFSLWFLPFLKKLQLVTFSGSSSSSSFQSRVWLLFDGRWSASSDERTSVFALIRAARHQ